MSKNTKPVELQSLFEKSGLQVLFIEGLGWSAPQTNSVTSSINGLTVAAKPVSSLKGYNVYSVEINERPTRSFMREVDSEISKLSPERLEIFQTPQAWFWHWPKRTNAGTTAFESIETLPNKLPLFLAQRLSGLVFTAADHSAGLTIAEVRNRVYGNFDASNVTKKFYDRFQKEHIGLSQSIQGIPEDDKTDYSTTLLNRLMFLYFLQKKQFLNDDLDYLENTLSAVQKLEGTDRYYSFYRDALLPLFFEKLNDRAGVIADPEIVSIIGDVPYVNGGLFGRNELEEEFFEELNVPDEAFEKIFRFFSEFNWHLDTRPTGNPNEINPEVIGYIFEQYINFTASGKKANGAYYTPHDVTAYMINQTLVPRIFDEFEQRDQAFQMLKSNPDRYIQPMMLHGWNQETSDWHAAPSELVSTWLDDPIHWPVLDAAEIDTDICLPGETWVEMFHRRDRVASLRERIAGNQLNTVNDLITDNINAQLLLTDVIDELDSGVQVKELFDQVTHLTVFDPTCGSGAFLFAALEVLEDIYAHLIDVARTLKDASSQELVALADEQPSTSYFIRKHCAIRNLYGTDLMPGAIETAKLRIFLALASCIDQRSQLQPLPDLDFNLKVGNLVVGFKNAEDVDRFGGDIVAQSHLIGLAPQIDEFQKLYDNFVSAVESNSEDLKNIKLKLTTLENTLRASCDELYAEIIGVGPNQFHEWLEEVRPFHWFAEFPEIIRSGGFDVLVGNPPYIKIGEVDNKQLIGYQTSDCSDFYAVCYERSLSLTAISGRHAFIVMSSLSFGEKFQTLRKLISNRGVSEWWSTFGKIPNPLFAGVRVRNTILLLGPGENKYSTRHHIQNKVQRGWLFQTFEYGRIERDNENWPIRAGVANNLFDSFRTLKVEGPTSKNSIYVRPTASYWLPVLLGPAPVLDENGNVSEEIDSRLREVQLSNSELVEDAQAILGGKIAYLWWTAVGDDFDINSRELDAPRAIAVEARSKSSHWSRIVEKVLQNAKSVAFVSLNKNWYFNVRWNRIRNLTDELDKLALSSLGFDDQSWRMLNILYRQVMRSSGDSAKGRYLTEKETQEILGW